MAVGGDDTSTGVEETTEEVVVVVVEVAEAVDVLETGSVLRAVITVSHERIRVIGVALPSQEVETEGMLGEDIVAEMGIGVVPVGIIALGGEIRVIDAGSPSKGMVVEQTESMEIEGMTPEIGVSMTDEGVVLPEGDDVCLSDETQVVCQLYHLYDVKNFNPLLNIKI